MADRRKRYKNIDTHSDYCIMPMSDNPKWHWEITRKPNTYRHEVFFGRANRVKSIHDGLVIFLTIYEHTEGKNAIHNNREFREYAEWVAMNAWCKKYNKTLHDFKKEYGYYAIEPQNKLNELFEGDI